MKKLIIYALVLCQLTVHAATNYTALKEVDPEMAAQFEREDREIEKRGAELDAKTAQLNRKTERLFQMTLYLKKQGHWLFDTKVTRLWMVPLAVALTGIYGHMRHAEIMNNPRHPEYQTVANLSQRQRYVSVAIVAGIMGAIGYYATEVGISKELDALGALSPDDVLRQYNKELCETNALSKELGLGPIRDNVNNREPECK